MANTPDPIIMLQDKMILLDIAAPDGTASTGPVMIQTESLALLRAGSKDQKTVVSAGGDRKLRHIPPANLLPFCFQTVGGNGRDRFNGRWYRLLFLVGKR